MLYFSSLLFLSRRSLHNVSAWGALCLISCCLSAHAATYVVDTTSDANLTFCGAAVGDCSLRGAINKANSNSGPDTITFNIPRSQFISSRLGAFAIIQAAQSLPVLTAPGTFIDGKSQPGYVNRPRIAVSGMGNSQGGVPEGLRILTSGCRVRGLIISNWITGLDISGPGAHSNKIEGCLVGGNSHGIVLSGGAHKNVIGGLAWNVISDNRSIGISIRGAGSNYNRIAGNIIGLDERGASVMGNGYYGIYISEGAQHCTIGSADAALRNIISGNGTQFSSSSVGAGIMLAGSETAFHVVVNNFIGTDATGSKSGLGNLGPGVWVVQAQDNRIGLAGFPRNLIAGNTRSNIEIDNGARNLIQNNFIGFKADGSSTIFEPRQFRTSIGIYINANSGAASGNIIGGTQSGARNVISGHASRGIFLTSGVNNTRIQGNYIGTNPAGDTALPNGQYGIEDQGGGTFIGGATPGARNVISGNGPDPASRGLFLRGAYTVVQGNYIGIDARGLTALPNQSIGIQAIRAVVIGGSTSRPGTGAGNVISGHAGVGIYIYDIDIDLNLPNVRVLGNLIGTDAVGRTALPNSEGIRVEDSHNAAIGDGQSEGRNIIAGNTGCGIRVAAPNGLWPTSTRIQGNYIGTDITGQRALPNTRGIQLDNSYGTRIGGATSQPGTGQGNLISGNLSAGIFVSSPDSGSYIYGNAIGVAADGITPLPNRSVEGVGGWGIFLNAIGFEVGAPGDLANVIAHNEAAGVAVVKSPDTPSTYSIRGNSIFNNGGLGIDLGDDGVTPNDPGDADNGANALQNYPILTSVSQSAPGAPLVLTGSLDNMPDRQFAIDVYASNTPDPSGYGEGETYLGSFNISTSGGPVNFNEALNVEGNLSGKYITLTATDVVFTDTSEFSRALAVNAAPAETANASQSQAAFVNGSAYASSHSITLHFSAPLQRVELQNITTRVNGQVTQPQSVVINGKVLTILLPHNSLKAGDEVKVTWRDLLAQSGQAISGHAPTIVVE